MKRAEFTISMKSPFRYIVIAVMVVLMVFGFLDIQPYSYVGDDVVLQGMGYDGYKAAFRFENGMQLYHIPIIVAELLCAVSCLLRFTAKRPWLLAIPFVLYSLCFEWQVMIIAVLFIVLYCLTALGIIRWRPPLIIALIVLNVIAAVLVLDSVHVAGGMDTYEDTLHVFGMSFALFMLSLALTPVRTPEEQARVAARLTQYRIDPQVYRKKTVVTLMIISLVMTAFSFGYDADDHGVFLRVFLFEHPLIGVLMLVLTMVFAGLCISIHIYQRPWLPAIPLAVQFILHLLMYDPYDIFIIVIIAEMVIAVAVVFVLCKYDGSKKAAYKMCVVAFWLSLFPCLLMTLYYGGLTICFHQTPVLLWGVMRIIVGSMELSEYKPEITEECKEITDEQDKVCDICK